MKKFYPLSLAFLLISTCSLKSQSYETERLFDKYRGEKGVVSVWLPGIVMKLAANVADLNGEEEELIRSIRSLRVLTIEDKGLYKGVNFTREANIKHTRNGYVTLVSVSDGDSDILILGREKRGKLKDLLVLVGGEDNVMVEIKGRLNADMLESIGSVAGLNNIKKFSSL